MALNQWYDGQTSRGAEVPDLKNSMAARGMRPYLITSFKQAAIPGPSEASPSIDKPLGVQRAMNKTMTVVATRPSRSKGEVSRVSSSHNSKSSEKKP